jgi:dTDP-4-dehydrorhamnose reductase
MHLAVLGSRGQLGAAVVEACHERHTVTAFDRAALDVTDESAVLDILSRLHPDAIVNCTAYNAVDAAERNPVNALQVNAVAVRSLARAARATGAVLVHYSTDFVFDGLADSPMDESHPTGPRSAYSVSKLLGEWFAADAERAYVLRVEALFGAAAGERPKGSLETILDGLRAGRTVRVFGDRTVSPTYVVDAARATLSLLDRQAPAGLYHCVNTGAATWLDVATEAASQLGVTPSFDIVSLADVVMPAARPRYCALSNAKLAAAGCPMPSWQDALTRHLARTR